MAPPDTEESAYVSFYRRHSFSPGSLDTGDLDRHLRRRAFLYNQLGLARSLIAGREVLEFGPGIGFNSQYTASCSPARYVLVDASEEAITGLRATLAPFWQSAGIEPVSCFFEDFASEALFDVVIAEACLSFQVDPIGLLKKIATHVVPGGVLVITCISPVSDFSEVIRRLMRDRVMSADAPLEEQLVLLRPIFGAHLRHLRGFGRTVDDWIADNIVQPLIGSPLPIGDAVSALARGFDIYGSSPRLFTDLRWYKEAVDDTDTLARLVVEQSHGHALNFLDYRLNLATAETMLGCDIASICESVWREMKCIEHGDEKNDERWRSVITSVSELASMVECLAPETSTALREACVVLTSGRIDSPMPAFERLWGRGQQFVSFVAHAG